MLHQKYAKDNNRMITISENLGKPWRILENPKESYGIPNKTSALA